MKALLAWTARHGAAVVLVGVVLGFGVPDLAAAARPCLTAAIFVFTFGALLKLDPASLRSELVPWRRNLALIAWGTLGLPLVVAAAILAFRPEAGLAQGLLLWALVPSSGACVAFAVLLGRPTPLPLLMTVATTALAPIALPWLAQAIGALRLVGDPLALSLRLLVLIGGAWVAAFLVRRYAARFLREQPDVMTGVAVIALFVAGVGSMRGMRAAFLAGPLHALGLLALAYLVFALAWLASALLFRRCGDSTAWTAGLTQATRTITLAWVVMGDSMLPMANVFLGCAMVAKYTAPAILKTWPVVARALTPSRRTVAQAE